MTSAGPGPDRSVTAVHARSTGTALTAEKPSSVTDRAQGCACRVLTGPGVMVPAMDMLRGPQIAEAGLTDWRKLAQGLHARYVVDGFTTGARFVAAVAEAGDEVAHHPRVRLGSSYVDLELVSDDAIYREDDGTEHVVEWVTQQDVDLARRVEGIAREHGLPADPASVSEVELGVETAGPETIAPVWAALLAGDPSAQGRGTPGDEVRDATGRVPNLMFLDATDGEAQQRFVVEVYVPLEAREARISALLAAGGSVVDDRDAPGFTVVADQEGNRGALCVDTSAVGQAQLRQGAG